ncbi:TPA: tyrosine-type recombinase/integrase [Escherichia coli]|uniref:tyrosine-type recombinase/integrase n=2 Tax=Escherichia coli TaxID=562 RepID=UPI0010CC2A81|nr:integrase arm-type DNA-binding domain-containing protein [Escherichia coli]MCN3128928.1 tyrosine-type recombinase/integrase [Escherichia coli]MCN3467963.1 tyrosine-type recombinase/integrase [Escherichia coli]MCN8879225.1 tyrosine-type recombinase/integrase [Escherichia coli]MDF0828923.1 tyrosine-type recombinase/integrase [Escherichia coli]WKR50699.1 tyrosine-type recombinase/integrase [Escherichia coli]
MALTDIQIKRAKPQDKPYTMNDGHGLSLLIKPDGSKGWRFRFRFAGKARLMSFGSYELVSLAEAREKRDTARKQVANGIDPVEERKAQKLAQKLSTENSFESVSREWHAAKADRWTIAYREEIIKTFEQDVFPFIGKRPISEIKPLELLEVLKRIEKRGALEKTRKVRQRCGEVFRYAIITGRAEYNPAPDLAIALAIPKQKHHPFLSAEELPHFVRDLESYTGSIITKNATKILMMTGVRTQEMRFATWSEIDLIKGIWEIPAERMKMRRPHIVPLSSQVIELFKQLQPITSDYPYVFIGRNDRRKPISKESVNQVIESLGYKGRTTGHGFRHTLSTILHEMGFESAWIEIQLAHVDKNTIRGTYNHALHLDKRKYMMQKYSDFLMNLSTGVQND